MITNTTRLHRRAKEDYKHYYRNLFFVDPKKLDEIGAYQNTKPGVKQGSRTDNDVDKENEVINRLFSKYAMYSPAMMAEINRFATACDRLYTTNFRNCSVSLKSIDGTSNIVTVCTRKCRGIEEALDLLELELRRQDALLFEKKTAYEDTYGDLQEQLRMLEGKKEPTEHLQRMYEHRLKKCQAIYNENKCAVRENKRLLVLKQLSLIQSTITAYTRLEMKSKNNINYYFEQIFRRYYREKRKYTRKEDRHLLHMYSPDYNRLQQEFFKLCPETEENIRDAFFRSDAKATEIMKLMMSKNKHGKIEDRDIVAWVSDLQQSIIQNEENRKSSRWEVLKKMMTDKENELKKISLSQNNSDDASVNIEDE